MDPLERIRKQIEESGLSGEYVDEFIYLIETADDTQLAHLADVFERDTAYLQIIYETYAKKKQAFESGSAEALQEVLEEEYRILKMLESDDDEQIELT